MANTRLKKMVLLAMFVAIELILGFVPNLGFIQTGTMQITTMHIPVILCGIILGVKAGGFTGFIFGLSSFINATFLTPNPLISPLYTPFFSSPAFESSWLSLVICFVPRILVGVFAALIFNWLDKNISAKRVSIGIAAVVGSLTNTVLVLLGIFFFFGNSYAIAAGIKITDILMAIVSINGIVEALVAAVLTILIAIPCFKVISER